METNLDKNHEMALKMALNGHNVLVTGLPGTGKSHVASCIAKQLQLNGKKLL